MSRRKIPPEKRIYAEQAAADIVARLRAYNEAVAIAHGIQVTLTEEQYTWAQAAVLKALINVS